MGPEKEVGRSFRCIGYASFLLNKDMYVHNTYTRNVMLWERRMMGTQMMLMLFSAFFCMFKLFLNKPKCQKLPHNLAKHGHRF